MEIIQWDGYDAVPAQELLKIAQLEHGDTVWLPVQGHDALPREGGWAVVDENTGDGWPATRLWGGDLVAPIDQRLFTWTQLHRCECGAAGPTSWRLCHPDA